MSVYVQYADDFAVSRLPEGLVYNELLNEIQGTPVVGEWADDEEEYTTKVFFTAANQDGQVQVALDIVVLRDTDGDGVPDVEDQDDDGDEVPDEEEVDNGTDPKHPNPVVEVTDPEGNPIGNDRPVVEGQPIEPIVVNPKDVDNVEVSLPDGLHYDESTGTIEGTLDPITWQDGEEERKETITIIGKNEKGETVVEIDIIRQRDTDNDGIPDVEDLDDDGDGIPDEEEIEQGHDPKDPDDKPVEEPEEPETPEEPVRINTGLVDNEYIMNEPIDFSEDLGEDVVINNIASLPGSLSSKYQNGKLTISGNVGNNIPSGQHYVDLEVIAEGYNTTTGEDVSIPVTLRIINPDAMPVNDDKELPVHSEVNMTEGETVEIDLLNDETFNADDYMFNVKYPEDYSMLEYMLYPENVNGRIVLSGNINEMAGVIDWDMVGGDVVVVPISVIAIGTWPAEKIVSTVNLVITKAQSMSFDVTIDDVIVSNNSNLSKALTVNNVSEDLAMNYDLDIYGVEGLPSGVELEAYDWNMGDTSITLQGYLSISMPTSEAERVFNVTVPFMSMMTGGMEYVEFKLTVQNPHYTPDIDWPVIPDAVLTDGSYYDVQNIDVGLDNPDDFIVESVDNDYAPPGITVHHEDIYPVFKIGYSGTPSLGMVPGDEPLEFDVPVVIAHFVDGTTYRHETNFTIKVQG